MPLLRLFDCVSNCHTVTSSPSSLEWLYILILVGSAGAKRWSKSSPRSDDLVGPKRSAGCGVAKIIRCLLPFDLLRPREAGCGPRVCETRAKIDDLRWFASIILLHSPWWPKTPANETQANANFLPREFVTSVLFACHVLLHARRHFLLCKMNRCVIPDRASRRGRFNHQSDSAKFFRAASVSLESWSSDPPDALTLGRFLPKVLHNGLDRDCKRKVKDHQVSIGAAILMR